MSEINKDGTVNKVYVRKMWNHVTNAAIDGFNDDLEHGEFERRVEEFRGMLNALELQKGEG